MESLHSLEFESDDVIVASGPSGVLRRWSAADGSDLGSIEPHAGLVTSIALDPAGETLLVGGSEQLALFDLSGSTPGHSVEPFPAEIAALGTQWCRRCGDASAPTARPWRSSPAAACGCGSDRPQRPDGRRRQRHSTGRTAAPHARRPSRRGAPVSAALSPDGHGARRAVPRLRARRHRDRGVRRGDAQRDPPARVAARPEHRDQSGQSDAGHRRHLLPAYADLDVHDLVTGDGRASSPISTP